MSEFIAPLRDIRFTLHEVLGLEEHLRSMGSEVSSDDLDQVLEQAAIFSQDVLSPLNAAGDSQGAILKAGRVLTPPGFVQAYEQFRDNGWPAIGGDVEFGGQGLPASIELAVTEMWSGANLAWRTYSGLSAGAALALKAHGDEALKRSYMPKLVSGESLATMCLTEPQCGTDLGLIRTRADLCDDGSYEISGTKMFITGGDHDLSNDIVHLVLARLPEAPQGSRGLSMFLVPTHQLAGSAPSNRNGVMCRSIEHKMGIRGSATCVLEFDRARGWLVGGQHQGLACMFTMMNHARLAVAMQGLGISQSALQRSIEYARERRQGKSPAVHLRNRDTADPIINHPDVRRMLLTQKSLVEGCRLLAAFIAVQLDLAQAAISEAERIDAGRLLALLTPIAKAFITDAAVECASLAVQVHGGHGYVRETGVEQLLRDARILPIYEGTNGVQALDLLNRKVVADEGKTLLHLVALMKRASMDHSGDAVLGPLAGQLDKALQEWLELTGHVVTAARHDPAAIAAAATDYTQFSGYVCLAWCWLRMAAIARRRATDDADDGFYITKLRTARFYFARILPRAYAHSAAARAGSEVVMQPEAELLV